MAITITGTLVIDETSGTQNPADTSDSSGNDIAGGAGVLPSEFDAALTALGLSGGSATGVAVSGATADNSTGTAMITGLPADLTDVSFTDSAGAALDGDDSGLMTTDGTKIFLYTYSGDNNVLLGVKGDDNGTPNDPSDDLPVAPTAAGAVIVFAAYLDTQTAGAGDAGATGAKVWVTQFESMFNLVPGSSAAAHDDPVQPDEVIYVTVSSLSTFSLEGAPSGQNLFLMYGDPNDSTNDAIVVTASDAATGGTVNTGQAGGGTTIGNFNQMLDAGEALTFTFVTGANTGFTVPDLTQTEADSEGNILFGGVKNATAASFKVVQTQPGSKAGTLTFECFTTDAEPGVGFIAGYGDDVHVDVDSVLVKNAAGTVIENSDGSVNTAGLSITITGGVATIVGVKAGYTIEYTTDGNHQRVEIGNSSATGKGPNGADFDIGDFQLTSTLVTPTLLDVLEFQDDGPSVAFGNLIGTGSINPQYGNWTSNAGTDGIVPGVTGLDINVTGFTIVRPNSTTATGTATLEPLAGSPNGSGDFLFSGTLSADFDNNPNTNDAPINYFLTALANGTYKLDLVEGFVSTTTTVSTIDGLTAGGPDPVQTLTPGAGLHPPAPLNDKQIVFFNVLATANESQVESLIGGDPDLTEAQIEGNSTLTPLLGTEAMNVSTSGIGVGNNNLNGSDTSSSGLDESFVANPEFDVTTVKVFIDNSVSGYTPATESLFWTLYYTDGSTSGAPVKVLAGDIIAGAKSNDPVHFDVQATAGKTIDAIQLTMDTGTIKVPFIEFVTEIAAPANDLQLAFQAIMTDGDGDTASSSFVANLFANELAGSFNFVQTGTSGADAFNIDLPDTKNTYQANAFTPGVDKLVLLGANSFTIDNTGANSIVDITETAGGQHTIVTVVGVDLAATDITTIV